jgi:hypothetical protein
MLNSLVTAFSAIPADPAYGATLEVNDGPRYMSEVGNMISVGVGQPSVSHRLVRSGNGVSYDEAYDITCLMWAWSGTKAPMSQHRNRCTTLLTAIRAALVGMTLSQNMTVRLGDSLEWTQSTTGKGAACAVQFSVHVVASI